MKIIKKYFFSILFIILILLLIIYSKSNILAANKALILWATTVVPSLFPFLILTDLLTHTPLLNFLKNKFSTIMKPLFNVSGIGSFPFIMGILSGYPIGAKITNELYKNNQCSKIECERLLSFTNNSGPLFIIGTVGSCMFGDTRTGLLLFITHILSAICVGIIFRFYKTNNKESNIEPSKEKIKQNKIKLKKETQNNQSNTYCTFSNIGEILSNSILNSTKTLFLIGGYVLIFSIITSILNNTHTLELLSNIITPITNIFNIPQTFNTSILSGLIELTNGINSICKIHNHSISINILLCSFILGFSGLSVILQVNSIIFESNLSIKPYIIGKTLQAIISTFLTYILLKNTSLFNLDCIPTISPNNQINYLQTNNIPILNICILIFIILIIIYILINNLNKQLTIRKDQLYGKTK